MYKGQGGGGGQQKWITKFLVVNIFNFAKGDNVGGWVKTHIHKKLIICRFFNPFLRYNMSTSYRNWCYHGYHGYNKYQYFDDGIKN